MTLSDCIRAWHGGVVVAMFPWPEADVVLQSLSTILVPRNDDRHIPKVLESITIRQSTCFCDLRVCSTDADVADTTVTTVALLPIVSDLHVSMAPLLSSFVLR